MAGFFGFGWFLGLLVIYIVDIWRHVSNSNELEFHLDLVGKSCVSLEREGETFESETSICHFFSAAFQHFSLLNHPMFHTLEL